MKNNNSKKIITKERIISDLKRIGVKNGDHLSVSLSFKGIGYVDGGPNIFIDALLETVGDDGTIMMNTFTRIFHISNIKSDDFHYIFDYRSTPCHTGIVPETFRKREGSLRSQHPTNSVAAIGKYAEYFTKDHNNQSTAYMPFSRLARVNGKVLCIGLGDNLIAIRHEAQYLAGLLEIVPYRVGVKFRDKDVKIKLFIRKDLGGCVKRMHELVPILRERGFVKNGKVGMANAIIVPAKESLEVMTETLKNNPAINLCNDISCLWCRELERRMSLYKKIVKPIYFQDNLLVIKFIQLMNWFRLRNCYFAEKLMNEIEKLL